MSRRLVRSDADCMRKASEDTIQFQSGVSMALMWKTHCLRRLSRIWSCEGQGTEDQQNEWDETHVLFVTTVSRWLRTDRRGRLKLLSSRQRRRSSSWDWGVLPEGDLQLQRGIKYLNTLQENLRQPNPCLRRQGQLQLILKQISRAPSQG